MYGEDFIKDFSIPIKTQKDIIIDLSIRVDNTNNRLRLINISDDQLVIQSKIGGYYMNVSYIAATTPNDPIAITAIESINNKTITVLLNQPFTGNEVFEVFETDAPLQVKDVNPVDDSINPEDNKKVLVAYDSIDPHSYVFETGVNYTLKITKDAEITTAPFTVGEDLPKPLNVNVEVIGNRILNVLFETPVTHLDYIAEDPVSHEDKLSNFYVLFYNEDSNSSLESTPTWLGLLNSSTTATTTTTTARKSADYKSLEIQLNHNGLPIGTHGLVVNYCKTQSFTYEEHLHDFSNDHVQVPTMRKAFEVVEDGTTAEPIEVVALDRTNLIVTFDKAVIQLNLEMDVIQVNGASVTITEVSRVGNQFNKLQYTIDNLQPLPVGLIDVTVGRITDANGYLTPETTFTDVPVVAIPPRILNVEQFENSQTQITVTFSKDMNPSDTVGGVRNISYYTVTALDGSIVPEINSIVYNIATRTATLEFDEELEAGEYVLSAEDIEDVFGLSMEPQSVPFTIIDTSVPVVESITFRDNRIVIKFNESMLSTGEHSFNNIENYLMDSNVLPYNTTSLTMQDDKWVRLTLPEAPPLPYDGCPMNIGYPKLKEIKYITNVSGNIYPLCQPNNMLPEIEQINILNGIVTVLTTEVLEYKYTLLNEFYNVDINDFEITLNGEIIIPLSLELVDTKTIKFVFEPDTFDGGSTAIKIHAKDPITNTVDIYGLKILAGAETDGTAINGLSASILGISLVKNFSSPGILRMTFNKPIDHFEKDDFMCVLNDSSVVPISSATLVENTNNESYQLEIGLSQALTMLDMVEIRLAVPENLIRTVDFSGNKIAPFTPIEVIRFIAEQPILWNKPVGSLIANSIIELSFNTPINPGSLIPDDKFDGTGTPWDGTSPLNVPEGKILFNGTGTEVVLSITDTPSFGTIVVEDLNTTFTEYNSAIAKLYLVNETKVILEFVDTEALSISGLDGKNISYTPYIDSANDNTIKDKTNVYFLYEDYKPTGKISNE